MSINTNDLLAGGGGKTASFENAGDTISGPIQSWELRQATDFTTGEPDTWDDGKPKMQMRVSVTTSERDPLDPEDDGVRNVYIKWWGAQRKALQDALRAAKVRTLTDGDHFTATLSGFGEPPRKGFNPPKLMSYVVKPAGQPGDLLGDQPAPVAQPAAPAAAGDADLAELKAKNPALAAALGHLPPAQQAEVLKNAGLAG